MVFNHRFLLRLITNLVIFALALSGISVVLWTIDEFIGWDILPETIGIYVRALILGAAWITFILIVIHLLLSLTLFAEASASRAKLPDFQISLPLKRKLKRIVLIAGLVSILLIVGLQTVDGIRKDMAERAAKQEAILEARKEFEKARIKFNQTQADVVQSLPKVLKLFTPSLLKSIQTNTIPASELNQLFESVTISFPHSPALVLLTRAEQPYKYSRLDKQAVALDRKRIPYLRPQLYSGFPTQVETEVVEQLFVGQNPSLKTALNGAFIRNTNPSSWGVLKLNDQVIALVYLEVNYSCPKPTELIKDTCIHSGSETLYSN